MALISLTVVSEGYVKKSVTDVRGFESTLINDLQVNTESDLGGNSWFVYNGVAYTVNETLATITSLTGGGGVSSDAGTGVTNVSTVEELGTGVVHTSIITLDTALAVTSVTTGKGGGTTKIYDFPEGRILVLGVTSDLTFEVLSANQGDFTDATPEGDFSIGTTADANLTLATTDVNLLPATEFTMADYAATGKSALASSAQFDGTTTAIDAHLNFLVDAGDIDDDASTEVQVGGTVTITWINLGTY